MTAWGILMMRLARLQFLSDDVTLSLMCCEVDYTYSCNTTFKISIMNRPNVKVLLYIVYLFKNKSFIISVCKVKAHESIFAFVVIYKFI